MLILFGARSNSSNTGCSDGQKQSDLGAAHHREMCKALVDRRSSQPSPIQRAARRVPETFLHLNTDLSTSDWEIVHGHLKKLESLLNDTAKFKSEYRLELVTTEEKLSLDDVAPPKKGFRNLFVPNFQNETEKALHRGVNVWKRLKWAAIDKDGISLLMNDVHRFVEDLWNMLRDEDLAFMRNGMEALMRHAISQSQGPKELSDLERLLNLKRQGEFRFEDAAVKSALSLKQNSLVLGYEEYAKIPSNGSFCPNPLSKSLSGATLVGPSTEASIPKRPVATRFKTHRGALSYKLLKTEPGLDQGLRVREAGHYEGRPVLVEWKTVDRRDESKLKHRIKTLAALLQDLDSISFHSLKCMGYLKNPKFENYGYIFQYPPETSDFMSLNQLLSSPTLAPSLDDRLSLAISLTETVLQLHTANCKWWSCPTQLFFEFCVCFLDSECSHADGPATGLHKGVRADNVIFFRHNAIIDIKKAYLGGYEYSRHDNPTDSK